MISLTNTQDTEYENLYFTFQEKNLEYNKLSSKLNTTPLINSYSTDQLVQYKT